MYPPAAYRSALPPMNDVEREGRVAIGVPLVVPPQQQMHEAWVAIRVPLIETLPDRKPSPCEKHVTRCLAIAWGIISTVGIFVCEAPLIAKILSACMIWVIPIAILRMTFRWDDVPEDDTVET